MQPKLGTPAGASISADIAAIEAQTDDIGAAGAGLTALGDTRLANLDATVSSRLATAGYTTPPTVAAIRAEMDANSTKLDVAVGSRMATYTQPTGFLTHDFSNPAGVKKNTALSNFEFVMFDATDHATPLAGLTVTATRNIDGAAFGACANAVVEVASGVYKINLAAADLNGDVVTLKFTATGADPQIITIVTEP